jgi:hypothetical protein
MSLIEYAYPDGTTSRDGAPRVLAQDWLPLSRAALCLDCETVYSLAAPACPRCGGSACMALAAWLKTVKK